MRVTVSRNIAIAAAAVLAGMAADRILGFAWTKATGRIPPTDPENTEIDITQAVTFAVVSGALIALARLLAIRGTVKLYAGPLAKRG